MVKAEAAVVPRAAEVAVDAVLAEITLFPVIAETKFVPVMAVATAVLAMQSLLALPRSSSCDRRRPRRDTDAIGAGHTGTWLSESGHAATIPSCSQFACGAALVLALLAEPESVEFGGSPALIPHFVAAASRTV